MTDGDGPTAAQPGVSEPRILLSESFTARNVTALRHALIAAVHECGMSGTLAEDFVLAVHELVTNAAQHGGGAGRLELRLLDDVLTGEVVDDGGDADGLPVRLSPVDRPGGRGLWLAHHLTGSLMLTRRPGGVTASVSACLTDSPGTTASQPLAQRARSPEADSPGTGAHDG